MRRNNAASGPVGAGAGAPPRPPPIAGDEDEGGSKFLVYQIFGPEVGNAMALAAGYGKKYDFRGVFEPVDASAQCAAIIDAFPADGAPCYLCGLAIPPKADLGNNSAHELYPECEHILPVTEARMYLDLYVGPGRERRLEEEDPSVQQTAVAWRDYALGIEYAWAHRVCNQAKTNDSFVKLRDDGLLQPSDKGFLKILSNIRKRATKHATSGAYNNADSSTFATIADTIIGRKTAILTERISPIIDHVNIANAAEAPGVMVLARVAGVTDPRSMSDAVVYAMRAAEGTVAGRDGRSQRFIDEFLKEYPRFASPALDRSLYEKLNESFPNVFGEDIVGFVEATVRESLGAYFSKIMDQQITTSTMASPSILSYIIYYGLYLQLVDIVSREENPEYDELLLTLYDQALAFFDTADPTADERIATLGILYGNSNLCDAQGRPRETPAVTAARARRGRAERANRRAGKQQADVASNEIAEDIQEELDPASLDDALTYYFGDLDSILRTNGVPETAIPAIIETIQRTYVLNYNSAEPEPRESLLNAIAVSYSLFIQIFGGEGLNVEQAKNSARDLSDILAHLGNEQFISEAERQIMVGAMEEQDAAFAGGGARAGGGKRTVRRALFG